MPSPVLSRLTSLSTVVAIAHRGGSKLRPENTMSAFEHAVSLGVDAVECDVHLSRDDEIVVIHDPTLDRTTDAQGAVSAWRAHDLARVDAAHQFGPHEGFPYRGAGIGIPRLEDVLRRWPATPFVIEIKGDRPETAARTLDVIAACGADERVIVGGFSMTVLAEVRRLRADLVTSASSAEVQAALRRSYFLLRPRRTGFHLFQVPVRLKGRQVLTRHFVRVLHRAGIPVQAWIVDELEEMQRLVDWGVTGLISDRPDRAVAVATRRTPVGRVFRPGSTSAIFRRAPSPTRSHTGGYVSAGSLGLPRGRPLKRLDRACPIEVDHRVAEDAVVVREEYLTALGSWLSALGARRSALSIFRSESDPAQSPEPRAQSRAQRLASAPHPLGRWRSFLSRILHGSAPREYLPALTKQ